MAGTGLTKAQLEVENGLLNEKLKRIEERVVKATVSYGLENESCNEGMAKFVQEVLNIPHYTARDMIEAVTAFKIKVTFVATIKGGAEAEELTEGDIQNMIDNSYLTPTSTEIDSFTYEVIKTGGE